MKLIGEEFFNRDPVDVAIDLLGKVLISKRCGDKRIARIVETEAYYARDDPASRASKGLKKYNKPMFEKAGLFFVYMVHRYWLLNITAKPVSAVLIRAVEPINFEADTKGPGKLSMAMCIDGSINAMPIGEEAGVYIADDGYKLEEVALSKRIGVKRDLDVPLRFYIPGNRWVSRRKRGDFTEDINRAREIAKPKFK